ncbi:hypothetical protein EJ06DRAFT_345366 [Trichodelitschia bisporula]|uniref:C3H1-type domain-containing protein n=1 Tax=Trichodelitschia bisporula TaxID=703511 RepID=A0A6G1I2L6_9PEZI|nr:hypothetical protein EJ06DRAFT_345366 [Trichodelitschia bisporula]
MMSAPSRGDDGPAPVRHRAPSATALNGHAPHVPPVTSMPVPHARMANGHHEPQAMRGGFVGPRSPPNGKNTSHVPCKFFRQGACQAGKACPFLHSESVGPCKYFQKGNCKFGLKCANEHITADGRRINKPGNYGIGPAPLNLGGRVMPTQGPVGNSLLSMQQDHLSQPQPMQPGPDYAPLDPWKKAYDIPTIDTTFSSHPGSNYGSPPNDNGGLPISPAHKGLSVMDAPLPASFDSQGISVFARNGPIAASVPTRFPFESSPPSSLPSRAAIDSSILRTLHSSAFGDDSRSKLASPPTHADEPLGRRIMHSDRPARAKMLSASVGARPPLSGVADEWDENFAFEEDLVPTSLQELLTPAEKMRRFSRTADDDPHRASLSGLGTPDAGSKVGSPSTASPSRFGALFSRAPKPDDGMPGASAFGHVGSPLRNASLHPGASPASRAGPRPVSGDVSPFLASPPRHHGGGVGMIALQLQRTRISRNASENGLGEVGALSPGLSPQPLAGEKQRPGAAPIPGVRSVSSGASVGGPGRLDRAVSSSSVGREKIEEEPD